MVNMTDQQTRQLKQLIATVFFWITVGVIIDIIPGFLSGFQLDMWIVANGIAFVWCYAFIMLRPPRDDDDDDLPGLRL